MSPLVEHLRRLGGRPALLTASTHITYAELADRAAEVAGELGPTRRLVLLEARNDVDTMACYLGALAGRHVVLPVPAGRDHDAIIAAHQPDVIVGAGGMSPGPGSGSVFHDDLALLMSTSGSTGSPKLVRLSHTNLIANATAIADYLGLRHSDRAATTLPMSYCYGLSVVHSHLLAGAALIVTDRSVADPEFWKLFAAHRGTSFAGVPFTFELLERIGFADMTLPHLRHLTQAGGRMSPDRVRRFAELAHRDDWQLFVMYGATEATARMAFLPPDLARTRPEAIGQPIPGGRFSIEPIDGWPDDGSGELVYHGPNVMMGYAERRADLALGSTFEMLHTGDVARRAPDGLYEIIGRRSRFVKLFGLRIDLDRLETALGDRGVQALCTDAGDRLAVAGVGVDPEVLCRLTATEAGIPPGAVDAVVVAELPVLPSGKPDHPAVRTLAAQRGTGAQHDTDLRTMYADVLHLDPATVDDDCTFVDLGGNSLSYVSVSARIERALGHLPTDWPRMTLRELQAMPRPTRRRWWQSWGSALDTSVALRAVAIVLIVGSHAELYQMWGGAHILLGVAGYNFGRFALSPLPRDRRIRHLRNTIAWIAIPSMLWIAVALLVTDDYHLTNLVLANKFLGPQDSMTAGRLWFIEVLVWTLVALAVLFWVPVLDRTERRFPFTVAAVFLAAGLALRYDVLGLGLGRDAWFTMLAFWFFAVGWAAAKASGATQRVAVTAVVAIGLYGYFGDPVREALVMTGLVLLIWLPSVRVPAVIAAAAGLLAEASLYIYLTHFQVYPLFGSHRLDGVIASMAVGIALTTAVTLLRHRFRERRVSVGSAVRAHAPR